MAYVIADGLERKAAVHQPLDAGMPQRMGSWSRYGDARLVFWTCEQPSGLSTWPDGLPIGAPRRSAGLLTRRSSACSSASAFASVRLLDCVGETSTATGMS